MSLVAVPDVYSQALLGLIHWSCVFIKKGSAGSNEEGDAFETHWQAGIPLRSP